MTTTVLLAGGRLKDDAKVFQDNGDWVAEFVVVVDSETWRAGVAAPVTETAYIGVTAVLAKFEGEDDQLYRGDEVLVQGTIGQYADPSGRRHTKVRAHRKNGLVLVRRGPTGRAEDSVWNDQPKVEPF
jgi:single-stranded DNA-binding protein